MLEGFQAHELNNSVFTVPTRYQNLVPIGSGSYGLVCSADDVLNNNERVAIKKFTRPFQSDIHAKRTYRELKFLRHMKHDNVIDMVDLFTPDATVADFKDVYFVSTLIGSSMYNVLKTQRLSAEHIKFLVYQMLRGLKYVHSAGIIHRDIKPSNIVVSEEADLKILDFGLARQQTDEEMTGYVVTRYYRAPEIILSWMRYNQTADIWSVGCIMAELMSGKILFPGDDYLGQLKCIMSVIGKPSKEFLKKINTETARNYVDELPEVEKKDLHHFCCANDPEAIDLLEKMLTLDPDHRITAAQALEHPYLQLYHDPEDEPVSESIDMSFEQLNLNINEWRERIWNEIQDFQNSQPLPMELG